MALGTIAATVLLAQTQPNTLTFKDGVFTVQAASGPQQVSTLPGFRAMNTSTGRLWQPIGNRVVTFDQNGLGIRQNNRASHSTLPNIAVSTKIMTQAEADEVNRAVAEETRTLDVAALSGWELVGTDLYLLCRWEDNGGNPWLEALVKVDAAANPPVSTLIGKFKGLSTAQGRVNDRLVLREGRLYVPTLDQDAFSLAHYNLQSGEFGHTVLTEGGRLPGDAKLLENSRYGVTFTKTTTGTILVGRFSVDQPGHLVNTEIRGSVLDAFQPAMLVHLRQNRKVVHNLLTGAELEIPRNSGLEPTPEGVLLWAPAQNPAQAALYTYGNFRTITRWTKTP